MKQKNQDIRKLAEAISKLNFNGKTFEINDIEIICQEMASYFKNLQERDSKVVNCIIGNSLVAPLIYYVAKYYDIILHFPKINQNNEVQLFSNKLLMAGLDDFTIEDITKKLNNTTETIIIDKNNILSLNKNKTK